MDTIEQIFEALKAVVIGACESTQADYSLVA